MSLGFPQPQTSFGNHHRQEGFSQKVATGEPPLRIRIEAIEIALGKLSQMVQDLSSDMEATIEEDNDASSEYATLVKRISDIEDGFESIRSVGAQLSEIEAANGLVAMHVRSRVSRSTKMYPNKTGDFKKDVKAGNTPIILPPETQIRLIFPQEQLTDGRVCMGGVCVDSESMNLDTGWVIVSDTKKQLHFVDSFMV